MEILVPQIEETGEYDLEALFIRLGYEIDAVAVNKLLNIRARGLMN
ncbi:hypothetical protein [Nostoc foliaceum]|uniref:Uncharacterized protein n=2 Tax=Nostoc TaxID=1177 RepID=A0ABR8I7W3_9NOSO|nr:hypothetical protein [Nostoc foliaceum]MBD2563809.1 hypothetical protein [Nostoc linckia FACHB-391]MBD2646743.1 hypothetical protein [Nostoc foliaceum FACHB-393]